MGTPREPQPVLYFAALLSSEDDVAAAVEPELAVFSGAVELRSETLPWTVSRYYEKEMGPNLRRSFASFAALSSPDRLADFKLLAQIIEDKYRWRKSLSAGRRVNIDPGYLEASKVVLASTKNAAHRIYLRDGIYGESALLYQDGAFQRCPHTYPDYLWPGTLAFFSRLRSTYLERLHRSE